MPPRPRKDDAIRHLLEKPCRCRGQTQKLAHELGEKLTPAMRETEDGTARRMFVLQYVQPGLAGLMDGSVSTLAPLFAAAFATHNTWSTFLVGLAAALGAGISMAFAEAMSDDGSLTGRGAPVIRGAVCGAMTASAVSATLCPTSFPSFMWRPRSPSPWWRWSWRLSLGFARITWIRHSCRPPSRWSSAASWSSPSVSSSAVRDLLCRVCDAERGFVSVSSRTDVHTGSFVRPAYGVAAAACSLSASADSA